MDKHDTQDLAQFRQTVYQNFNKRADTLMDLVDALCSQTRAKSVVELSLESCFRPSYSAIFKAINAYRPGEDDLAKLAGSDLPQPEQRPFWLLGVDVTSQPRPYARTLEESGFVYQPALIWGNKPVTIGHQYSTVALLPEKEAEQPAPWVVPLSCRRIKLEESKAQVGAAQIGALLGDERLPFHDQLTVEVGDSDYAQPLFLAANRAPGNLVSLVRSRGNRIYYRLAYRSAKETGGAPGHYGQPFKLKDPRTWGAADETARLPVTSRRGRHGQVIIQAWHNLIMKGKHKPRRLRMYDYPFTLVRIVLLDEDGQPLFKHPLWLLLVGERRHELSLEAIYRTYAQRSDLEHFFRFGKQKLLLADYQTPDVAREERWWQLAHLAYLQLWVAREATTSLPRPWERNLPQHRSGKTTPTLVQRDFERLISQFGTPAKAPKPRGKSPGRTKGFRLQPRQRHDVLRKCDIPPP
jgi:hypothetical protein